MKFTVDDRIFEKYPDLHVGVLSCHDITNNPSPAELRALLRAEEEKLRLRESDPEQLKQFPTIAAWQEVHRQFGSNPNKFMSSVHALAKRVIKGNNLPEISSLVDAYNIVSLNTLLPIGGEDIDTCVGDIQLTIADGTESFVPLGEEHNDAPDSGEVIYRDDEGVICRKFNWREAARTCLTEKTRNAVLVIEAIPPTTAEELSSALHNLSTLVHQFSGGTINQGMINRDSRSFDLSL